MHPISIEKMAIKLADGNGEMAIDRMTMELKRAVNLKKNGGKCMICGKSIWAIGTALCYDLMCYTCVTGETETCDVYEIDEVCWNEE